MEDEREYGVHHPRHHAGQAGGLDTGHDRVPEVTVVSKITFMKK